MEGKGCYCSTKKNCASECSKYDARYKKIGLKVVKFNKPIASNKRTTDYSQQIRNNQFASIIEKIFPDAHGEANYQCISCLHFHPFMRLYLQMDRKISGRPCRPAHERYLIPESVAVICGINIEDQEPTLITNEIHGKMVYAIPSYTNQQIEEDISYLEGLYQQIKESGYEGEEEEERLKDFQSFGKLIMGLIELPNNNKEKNNNKQPLSSPDRRRPLPSAKKQYTNTPSPLDVPSSDIAIMNECDGNGCSADSLSLTNTVGVAAVPDDVSSSLLSDNGLSSTTATLHLDDVPLAAAATTKAEVSTEGELIEASFKVKDYAANTRSSNNFNSLNYTINEKVPSLTNMKSFIQHVFKNEEPRDIIPTILESNCIKGIKRLPLPNDKQTLVGLMTNNTTPICKHPPPPNSTTIIGCKIPFYMISRWSNRFNHDAVTNGILHANYNVVAELNINESLSKQLIPINILHNKKENTKARAACYNSCFNHQSRYENAIRPTNANHDKVPSEYKCCMETSSQTLVYIDKNSFIVYAVLGDLIEEEELVRIKDKSLATRSGGDISDFFGVVLAMLYEQKRNQRENEITNNKSSKRTQMPKRFTSYHTNKITEQTLVLATKFLENIDRFSMDQLSRIPWSAVNVLRRELDKYFEKDYQSWRERTRETITRYCKNNNIEVDLVVDNLDFIIMAHSQEQKDDQSFELGTMLYDGGYAIPQKFMKMLSYCTYDEIFDHLSTMFKPFSMQNQKALVHFSSMFLTAWVFDGEQPIDERLMSYMQIGKKKFNVLSGISKRGRYTQPGIDVHVENWTSCILQASGVGSSTSIVHKLLDDMPEYPGAIINDVIAQIGQILHRGDDGARDILEDIFHDAISTDMSLQKVIDRWKNMYGANIGELSVLVKGKRHRTKTTFYY